MVPNVWILIAVNVWLVVDQADHVPNHERQHEILVNLQSITLQGPENSREHVVRISYCTKTTQLQQLSAKWRAIRPFVL